MRHGVLLLFLAGCAGSHEAAVDAPDAAALDARPVPLDAPAFDAPCLETVLALSGTVDGLDLATLVPGDLVGGGCSASVSSAELFLHAPDGDAIVNVDFGEMVRAGSPLGPRDVEATVHVGDAPVRDATFHLDLAEASTNGHVHFAGTLDVGGAGGRIEGWVCSVYLCF